MFEYYKNKRVFITGHTGFKGSWLSLWLEKLGASVCGYSLEPNTSPSMFEALNIKSHVTKSVIGDILDVKNLEKTMSDFNPDIVFHLAAQPLVRLSYSEPLLTYKTNVIGSLNVLQAAKNCNCPVVNITTDKCYENKEVSKGYKENDMLGGYDMYSSSKACVEIMTASFRNSFNLNVATARAGNVIGGGDWAKDRLIPDCIRCINNGEKIEIRNPYAVRPWQHVLEPLSGYLILGDNLSKNKSFAQAFNFGPKEDSVVKVLDVAKEITQLYGKGEVIVNKKDNLHEAELLMLNIQKSHDILNWEPKWNFTTALKNTVEWYKSFYENKNDLLELTLNQIIEYEDLWNKN